MINKNNELPSFVNETNLPNIVNKLTDAKNIKIANNKYGNRVQTVVDKIVEKADDITKAIKQEVVNDSYSFKVGTGNVDVSADVEDGFGEVGIKGVTYQNLFNDFSFSGEASKYITANENTIKWTKSAVTTFNVNIKYHNALVELNRVYTLVFYVYKNTLQKEGAEDSYNVAKFNIVSYNSGVCFIPVNKTGLVKVKLQQPTTTPSDGKPYLEVYKDMVGELEISYPILLEGDYTNDDKIPSQFEGIVGVGDKSKNLFNPTTVKNNVGVDISNGNEVANAIRKYSDFIEVIPSKYSFEVEGNCKFINIFVFDSNKNFICTTHENGTLVGDIKKTIDFSKEIFKGVKYIRILLANSTETNIIGNEVYNFYLNIGESVSSKYQYYDRYKIEILSNGKNLANPNNIIDSIRGNDRNWNVIKEDNGIFYCKSNGTDAPAFALCLNLFNLKDNTSYRVSYSVETNGTVENGDVAYAYVGTDTLWDTKKAIPISNNTFANPTGNRSACLGIYYRKTAPVRIIKIYNLQVVEVPQDSKFEPYIEDKTQILLDEPLMRLPNGVCDEITRDGKLIRRVGKAVLDGSEAGWKTTINLDELTYRYSLSFKFKTSDNYDNVNNILCNDLATKNFSNIYNNGEKGITTWWSNDYIKKTIVICLSNNYSLEQFKEWLSQNPITVYYELETPIITELPAPYLRIFKDGHLTFNTLVAPESSHVVQLNKSAQIQNAIKESQSLDNRINVLENNYDNLMLSTISRLNDLELNYTLK